MTRRTTKARFRSTRTLNVSPLLTLEVALTAEERATGLMGRAVLPPHHGMLFIFPTTERHGFWMKNTPIALDLAWLSAAGVVQEVVQLYPNDERLREPKRPATYVIELPAGSLALYDVRIGDQLVLL